MNLSVNHTHNASFVSAQKFHNMASEKNSFEKYGFYAWGNKEKTVLNPNYIKFKNPSEAKKFLKENVDLKNCSFEDYWIASRILADNGVLDSKKHWKCTIPIGLMLRNIPGVTNPIYTRYFDGQKHDWVSHFYEFSCKDEKFGDLKSAENLKEAANIFSQLV